MPTRPPLLHEMTREQARAAAPDSLAIIPIGSTEQHGPHLPVGTDFLCAERIAHQAAADASGRIPLLVTPTLPFGSSHHHLPFGGTMSLPTDLYYRVLMELGQSLIVSGFRRLFFVNGHGGNHEVVQLVARDLALQQPVHAAAASWWVTAWDDLIRAGAGALGRVPGHAGPFETSLIMAGWPHLVRAGPLPHRDEAGIDAHPRSFEAPFRQELHGSWQAIEGYTGSPDLASAEAGRTFFDAASRRLAEAFVDFYGATQSAATTC